MDFKSSIVKFALVNRPTGLPGGNPETDRTVMMAGRPIARVSRIEAGQRGGQWVWSCLWVGGGSGVAATREDALGEIKSRVKPNTLDDLPPVPPHWHR